MWKCHIFFRRWNFFAVRVLDLSVFLVWTHPTIFLTDDKAHSECLHLVYVYLYNHGGILCEHLLYKHLFTKYKEVHKEWVGRFGAQAHLHPVRKKFSSNAICSKFSRWTFLVQIIELSQPAMLLSGQSPGPAMLLSGNGDKNMPQPHTIVVFLASYQKPTKIVLFINKQLPRVSNMKSLNHLVYVKTWMADVPCAPYQDFQTKIL